MFAYLPLTKCETIGVHSRPLTCTASDIIEASDAEVFLCLGFEFIGVCGHGWESVV